MRNKITFTIICFCIACSVNAKEPFLPILKSTFSNEVQKFGEGSYTFECTPYGVLTLEKLYNSTKLSSICKKTIKEFYSKNQMLKEYTNNLLEYQQQYHVEIKDKGCVVYAKGQMTLSELLLKEGLGVMQPTFKDKEFENYFILAQRRAKMEKKGLWNTQIFTNCIEEFYK